MINAHQSLRVYWVYAFVEMMYEKGIYDQRDSLDECRSMAMEQYLFGLYAVPEEDITDFYLEILLRSK